MDPDALQVHLKTVVVFDLFTSLVSSPYVRWPSGNQSHILTKYVKVPIPLMTQARSFGLPSHSFVFGILLPGERDTPRRGQAQ